MSEKNESRDWELECEACSGHGYVLNWRQVAERKTDLQEFKEECECCEGRGFTIAFEDIPGIEAYVKSCRPVADAPLTSMARAIFGDQIGGQMDAMAGTPAPSAPGDAQDERQAFEAWAERKKMPLARIGQQYDDFWVDHAWNGWQARARLSAPAAGDALDATRYRWLRTSLFQQWFAVGEAEIGMRVYGACPHASEIDAAIDAALSAQVPQQGEA